MCITMWYLFHGWLRLLFICYLFKISHSYFLKFLKFIYFWLCWVFVAARRLFSSCGEQGLLFVVVHGLLIAVVSLVVKHGL